MGNLYLKRFRGMIFREEVAYFLPGFRKMQNQDLARNLSEIVGLNFHAHFYDLILLGWH